MLMLNATPRDTQMSKVMLVNITLILERRKAETQTVVSSSLISKLKSISIEIQIYRINMEPVENMPSKKPLKTTLIGDILTIRT